MMPQARDGRLTAQRPTRCGRPQAQPCSPIASTMIPSWAAQSGAWSRSTWVKVRAAQRQFFLPGLDAHACFPATLMPFAFVVPVTNVIVVFAAKCQSNQMWASPVASSGLILFSLVVSKLVRLRLTPGLGPLCFCLMRLSRVLFVPLTPALLVVGCLVADTSSAPFNGGYFVLQWHIWCSLGGVPWGGRLGGQSDPRCPYGTGVLWRIACVGIFWDAAVSNNDDPFCVSRRTFFFGQAVSDNDDALRCHTEVMMVNSNSGDTVLGDSGNWTTKGSG
eukprot:1142103-Pelagomonas_calceolata.AAC.2